MTTIISASQVKELRKRTGAAMMDCKRALEVSAGDIDNAIIELRKKGKAKADNKAGRIAAEGIIIIAENEKQAAMVEINSETDFVARDTNLVSFAKAVGETALQSTLSDVSELSASSLFTYSNSEGTSRTVEEVRQELVTKVGENVQVRRVVLSNPTAKTVGTYIHGSRIGVIVELDTEDKELARDIAMHIAASRPLVIEPTDVAPAVIAREKEVYMAEAANSGKPQEIIEKMVMGRLKKYLDEVSLMGQLFVKQTDITVGALLNKHRARVLAFYRYEVGEGIDKASQDFKEAVMSQMQGS